ncbi:MAG: hypothetical protein M1817_000291 [Caeruleum heppii]|nr:MAG: hypothetical protein M1817_000291 [Caeruleum heppii]
MVRTDDEWAKDRVFVERILASTPFECTDLQRLDGGFANFTYRGTLAQSTPDGSSMVIVKHAEDLVGPDFALSATRSSREHHLLAQDIPQVQTEVDGTSVTVRCPRALHEFPQDHVHVLEYLPESSDLKALLCQSDCNEAFAQGVGSALGSWAKQFHCWGLHSDQAELRQRLNKNDQARELKYRINCGRLQSTIEEFPALLGAHAQLFQAVSHKMKEIADDRDNGIIHGDFWTGNILFRKSWFEVAASMTGADGVLAPTQSVFVLDWEICQVSSFVFDLGQMLAEMYCLWHFRRSRSSRVILESFLSGYGAIEERSALDILIVCGVHLIVWPWRVPGWGNAAQMEECITFGRELVDNAYHGRVDFFRAGPFGSMFRDESVASS